MSFINLKNLLSSNLYNFLRMYYNLLYYFYYSFSFSNKIKTECVINTFTDIQLFGTMKPHPPYIIPRYPIKAG